MSVLKDAHAPTIHGGNFIGTQNNYHPPAPHSEEDKLSILLEALTKNNSRGVHGDNLAKRAEGTGIWFVDTVLEPWFHGTEEKLCIKGGPGTGKTTLLAIAVDHLETLADETEGMLVGYFYCEHGNKTVTIADALLVFLRQHLERDPDPSFVALVEKAWKRHKRENTKFRQPELERLLKAIVQRRPNTVYLLDALDEFSEDLQTDLVKSLSSLGARLIITSRLSDQLEKQFREKTTFFEARARDADLDGLLHDRINRSRKLAAVIGQSDFRVKVAETIRANCNGIQIDHYRQEHELKYGISALMDSLMAGVLSAGLHGQPAGGVLSLLFYRLAEFLPIPAHFVFVFDGNQRPTFKRGRSVPQKHLSWEAPAKEFISAFGYDIVEAPGEAEAELARLNRWGIVDAVFTSDLDIFVFGACQVFRIVPAAKRRVSNAKDEVEIYTREVVEAKLGLDRNGLLLYALLAGGDYSNGIPHFGPGFSLVAAQSGLGADLFDRLQGLSSEKDQANALGEWRQSALSTLQRNEPPLKVSKPARAALLKALECGSFPSLQVVLNYTNPPTAISSSPEHRTLRSHCTPVLHPPNLKCIKALCETHLQWRDTPTLIETFRKKLLEGVIIHVLYSSTSFWEQSDDASHQFTFGTSTQRMLVKSTRLKKHSPSLRYSGSIEARLQVLVPSVER